MRDFQYVSGYLKRIVLTREPIACCGGCVITAPAPERWAEKTRYAASVVVYLADVLGRIDRVSGDDELAALLPHRWKPPPRPPDAVDFDGYGGADRRLG